MSDQQYFENNGLPKLLALLVAAVVIWPLGRMLNRGRPDRELVDAETGERVVLRRGGHTFFFIPVEYWAPLFVLIGIVLLFVK